MHNQCLEAEHRFLKHRLHSMKYLMKARFYYFWINCLEFEASAYGDNEKQIKF